MKELYMKLRYTYFSSVMILLITLLVPIAQLNGMDSPEKISGILPAGIRLVCKSSIACTYNNRHNRKQPLFYHITAMNNESVIGSLWCTDGKISNIEIPEEFRDKGIEQPLLIAAAQETFKDPYYTSIKGSTYKLQLIKICESLGAQTNKTNKVCSTEYSFDREVVSRYAHIPLTFVK